MARAKTSEPSRVRSKAATVEELTRGVGNLQEYLAQVEDLGREGFPYLDAARARTELQFRECIRRTFGEKSPEFQEHRHHRLLMDTPEAAQQSIALIKTLITTLEQKKCDLQGGPSSQQIPPALPVSPVPVPARPKMTVVPSSISTVQVAMTQTGSITIPQVTMATNLTLVPATAEPSPPPALPVALVSSQKLQPLSPSIAVPEPSPISPTPVAMVMSHAPSPLEPVVPVTSAPQPLLSQLGLVPATVMPSSPPASSVPPAPVHKPEVLIPSTSVSEPSTISSASVAVAIRHASSQPAVPVALEPQPPQPEPEPSVHPTPFANLEPKMQEAFPVLLNSQPPASMLAGSSSLLEPGHRLAPAGSDPVELVKAVCGRFHAVVRQLRLRGEYRATLQVEDEVDAQDLLHVLLRVQFNNIDTDEWTPSYSSGALRTTLLLNESRLAVIVKKTRPGLTAKDLTDQLRVDAARYRFHGRCTTLLCFMYDPDGRIGNPQGFEASLTSVNDSFIVDVLVAPK